MAILLVVVGCSGPRTDQPPPPAVLHPPDHPLIYLADPGQLQDRARMAAQGQEPYASAIEELVAYADDALSTEPRPKQRLKISGTGGDFVDDSTAAYGLALASVVTGEQRYARKAAEILMSWADTTEGTRDACPNSGECNTSLVLGRQAPALVFAANLIESQGVLNPAQLARFRGWLYSVLLPGASERINNWGDAGVLMQVVLNDYTGDREGFARAIDRWKRQMDLVAADGHIPEETRREQSGMMYTQDALTYKIAVTAIAERRGINLWDYQGKGGGTLRKAVDFLAHYWFRPEEWPFAKNVDVRDAGPLWELAYAHWRDPSYVPIIQQQRPFSDRGHSAIRWTTLTSGIPLPDDGTAGR
ncbi:MAG: alginate lyase family protein [Egibacteraceae bacterium]